MAGEIARADADRPSNRCVTVAPATTLRGFVAPRSEGRHGATRVLVLGLDPRAVPGYDPEPVVAAIERGRRRFEERGITCHLGLVPLDDSAEGRIAEFLQREPYECVVIGGGIRKEEELLGLFENVVNLVRRHAPQAAIAFNTTPDDMADAAERWLGHLS